MKNMGTARLRRMLIEWGIFGIAQIVLIGAEFARSLEDMRQAGPDRYIEIPWLKGFIVSWGRRVPVAGPRLFREPSPRLLPGPQPTAPVEALVITESTPLPNGAAPAGISGDVGAERDEEESAPGPPVNGAEEPRRRPGAFAGVAMAAGAVAALVSGIRRRE